MTETIRVDVPPRSVGNDLTDALAARGLQAEFIEDGDDRGLHVRFAQGEHERLVTEAMLAIEAYLSDHMLPFVVERSDGSFVVRPPSD